jgi:hypothetical protein
VCWRALYDPSLLYMGQNVLAQKRHGLFYVFMNPKSVCDPFPNDCLPFLTQQREPSYL